MSALPHVELSKQTATPNYKTELGRVNHIFHRNIFSGPARPKTQRDGLSRPSPHLLQRKKHQNTMRVQKIRAGPKRTSLFRAYDYKVRPGLKHGPTGPGQFWHL